VKKNVLLVVMLFFASMIFSQDYVDVVEKKDGSILKGIVIENKINDYVKIELTGGSVFKIEYRDIDLMRKEKVASSGTNGSIVINNSNNNSNGANKSLIGYDHFQLVSILEDLPLSKLKKVKIDSDLIRTTDIGTRMIVYNSLEKESALGYTVLNIFLPGIGSVMQGDKKGWLYFISSSLCYLIGYSLISDYAVEPMYDDSYYYGESSSDESQFFLGAGLMVVSGLINISSWFAPTTYKNEYNKQLRTTLMY